jgi:hypothetical protein
MTPLIFLPLVLGMFAGLILLFIINSLLNQHQPQIINLNVPSIPPNVTLPKIQTFNECTHDGNQTLDSGILCFPNDTQLTKQYNGAPII